MLQLLLDPIKSLQLKIELSAYVEGLQPLRNICYWLETDATDAPFRAYDKIEALVNQVNEDGVIQLNKTDILIDEV